MNQGFIIFLNLWIPCRICNFTIESTIFNVFEISQAFRIPVGLYIGLEPIAGAFYGAYL